jgi:hypothetical protein
MSAARHWVAGVEKQSHYVRQCPRLCSSLQFAPARVVAPGFMASGSHASLADPRSTMATAAFRDDRPIVTREPGATISCTHAISGLANMPGFVERLCAVEFTPTGTGCAGWMWAEVAGVALGGGGLKTHITREPDMA